MVWLWQKRARKETRTEVRTEDGSDRESPWVVARIGASGVALVAAGQDPDVGPGMDVGAEAAGAASVAAPIIVRVAGEVERWALVGSGTGNVRVNGLSVSSGIRMLRHRDEIMVNGSTEFFSTERLAEVEPFPGSERAAYCGRCQVELVEGEGIVRCPGCPTLYHQNPTRSCWTYHDGNCPFCGHPGTLDGRFLWTPEAI